MAEIEKSFSSIFSKWHGQEIVVIFSDDQLMALDYHQALGVVQQTPDRFNYNDGVEHHQ